MARAILRCIHCNSDDIYQQVRVRANTPKTRTVLDAYWCGLCNAETQPRRRNEITGKVILQVARGHNTIALLRKALPEYTHRQVLQAAARAVRDGKLASTGLVYQKGLTGALPATYSIPPRAPNKLW